MIAAAQAGDRAARARLIEAFLPLVASVARIYRSSPRIERFELFQEGVVGLLRAQERYDPSAGSHFGHMPHGGCAQAMQQLVAELTRPVARSVASRLASTARCMSKTFTASSLHS